MRVLGVDPGTVQAGWAILEDGKLIDSGTITPPKSKDYLMRLRYIFGHLVMALKEEPVDALAIENQFSGPNPSTGIKIGTAKGVAIAVGFLYEVEPFEYGVQQWKKTLTGKGNASKELVAETARAKWPEATFESQDEMDAAGIALHHWEVTKDE